MNEKLNHIYIYSEAITQMNIIKTIGEFIIANPLFTLIGATGLIQLVPIKINPWTKLIKWVGKTVNHDLEIKVNGLEAKIDSIESKVGDLSDEVIDERVQTKRRYILDFTNSCRQGRLHTKEEWNHCLDELREYEAYCRENEIPNGVVEESSIWLKRRYQTHLDNDDFLKD